MADEESAENRFAHLLQPIRELAKNWDIDVAAELNDYLAELDEMCITYNGGKMDFAEAALLIQGSTGVYCRKVELLHKLFVPLQCTVTELRAYVPPELLPVVILPPESLIMPESREKQKLPLISAQGVVQGSHKDFRINIHTPNDEGVILFNLSSTALSNGVRGAFGPSTQHPVDGGGEPEVPRNHGANDGGAADDGGGGDDFMPLEDNGMEMDLTPEEHIQRQRGPSEGRVLRERRDVRPADRDADRLRDGTPTRANIWQLHDLYEAFGENQPLKTGKCYRVPDGLDDRGKRKRKGSSPLQDFRSWFTGLYDPPEHKLKCGPTFTDLNYIYLSKVKAKGVVVSDEALTRTFLQAEVEAVAGEEENLEGNRHPDLQDGDDDVLSDGDQEPLAYDDPAELGGREECIMPGSQWEEQSYQDLVKKGVEQFLVNTKEYFQKTELARRIKDWEDKIQPELLLQEERETFDIHDYSDRVVSALGTVGGYRSLASVVHGLDNFEACKYMLASLQLANDYTVEISSMAGLEESLDTMGLTLLSTHRATERFNTLGSI
ncbi:hypothetical protein NHX12_020322 [Muraenolepis orangiensis]|uniref:Condensin-2 complex subunit H2 n=1 Tax=Muraenolepis orangiensis TaxID=630683 RepID=A0A9Q0ERD8_9TELE|nr:hypothetical protein NHX12_020322 [Muraenolepis orangiensis]